MKLNQKFAFTHACFEAMDCPSIIRQTMVRKQPFQVGLTFNVGQE